MSICPSVTKFYGDIYHQTFSVQTIAHACDKLPKPFKRKNASE